VLYLAREAVANALRHSQATQVRIELARVEDRMMLKVADNGRGFKRSTIERSGRYGLRNMAERARLVGGHLEIDSRQGHGTEVRLEVPI
jgi:signal transduction histidine kinase